MKGGVDPWCDRFRERLDEWTVVDAERAALLRRSVELPEGLIDNADAWDAVSREPQGKSFGH